MIATVMLVVIGTICAAVGYQAGDDTVLTVGIVILIFAAFIGILTLADRYRHR